MPESVIVLLKVVMPVIDEDTVNVITAAVDWPAVSMEPCLFQLAVM